MKPQRSSSLKKPKPKFSKWRRRRRGIARVLRGIMLEGMGIAVLMFLYFSMNISADTTDFDREQDALQADASASQVSRLEANHLCEPTWQERQGPLTSTEIHRPLAMQSVPWASWPNQTTTYRPFRGWRR